MHGVQVVHESLHSLEGLAVGVARGVLLGVGHDAVGRGLIGAGLNEGGHHGGAEIGVHLQRGDGARLLLDAGEGLLGEVAVVGDVGQQVDALGDVLLEQTAEGLAHTHGQAVVEVADGLAAVLIVLIGLNSDAGQRAVAADVVGLAQEAVPRAEAAPEELLDVDLAAGGGERQKVEIVDVDVAVLVREAVLGVENVHLVELLRAFAAVFQHRAHSGVAVDVGVLALEVVVLGVLEGQIADGRHQPGVHFPDLGTLMTVEDVGLGRARVAALDEGLFHQILHLLHVRDVVRELLVQTLQHLGGNLEGKDVILPALTAGRTENRLRDLVHVKRDNAGVSFLDGSNHSSLTFKNTATKGAAFRHPSPGRFRDTILLPSGNAHCSSQHTPKRAARLGVRRFFRQVLFGTIAFASRRLSRKRKTQQAAAGQRCGADLPCRAGATHVSSGTPRCVVEEYAHPADGGIPRRRAALSPGRAPSRG